MSILDPKADAAALQSVWNAAKSGFRLHVERLDNHVVDSAVSDLVSGAAATIAPALEKALTDALAGLQITVTINVSKK
jgi:hypothetical protein